MRKNWLMAAWITAGTLGATTGAAAATLSPGIDAGVTYTQDYFRDVSGGLKRGGGGPGTIDLSATVDGRAWGGSQADVFYVDFLGTLGGSISNQVGDLQGLDNIEAYNTAKVFEAWYQHSFSDSGVSLRLGLQDYNALFNALEAAGLFINSSFGLDPTIAQAEVSTFPVTSLGAVLRWQASNGLYVMGGVYDGVPGLPGHPAGTHIELRPGAGRARATLLVARAHPPRKTPKPHRRVASLKTRRCLPPIGICGKNSASPAFAQAGHPGNALESTLDRNLVASTATQPRAI